MRYISTRGGSEVLSFKDVLLAGLAKNGGLYMPESYPQLKLAMLRDRPYTQVAMAVISEFATDIPKHDLRSIIERTYTRAIFGTDEITPVQMLDENTGLLKLSNGPTLAFKDVPLQLVGNLMEYVLAGRNEVLNILGATSGDTGSAAAYALRGKQRINLFMLSPYGRMSRFQQLQMYTLNERNIFNLAVDAPFDPCQAVVKEVNADLAFKERYSIGAVNSINWVHIMAQVVYYVFGYLQATTSNGERITFVVPSGNFGNAFSAFVAKKMGLPIDIIIATNENDVLDEFFRKGVYRVRPSSAVAVTTSPSMDIASASNFERLVFDIAPHHVAKLWENLKTQGYFDARFMLNRSRAEMRSGVAHEEDVVETIRSIYRRFGVVIDPHTAVGMHVGLGLRLPNEKIIVAETAQPAKFADTIRMALGIKPPVPEAYKNMARRKKRFTWIKPYAEEVKEFIAEHV